MNRQNDEWFVDWFDSPYYHLLYGERDEQEAQDFIDVLIAHLQMSQRHSVLDLACGKGRHARHIASKGLVTHGLDLSPASISYCKQYSEEGLSFSEGDMRNFRLQKRFDLVANLFTSFGYFQSIDDNLEVLKSISEHLHDKGRFVIDFLNVVPVLNRLPLSEEKLLEGTKFSIKKYEQDSKIIKEIEVDTGSEQMKFRESVQALQLDDMQRLVTNAGLIVDEVFGDYTLQQFEKDRSPRLIIVGHKPSASI